MVSLLVPRTRLTTAVMVSMKGMPIPCPPTLAGWRKIGGCLRHASGKRAGPRSPPAGAALAPGPRRIPLSGLGLPGVGVVTGRRAPRALGYWRRLPQV